MDKITICYDDNNNVIEVYEFEEEIEDFPGIDEYHFATITKDDLGNFNFMNDLYEKAINKFGGK